MKRNISKKLDKLERRTQIAIAELIRKLLLFWDYNHVIVVDSQQNKENDDLTKINYSGERIMGNSDKVQSLDKATEDLDAANRNIEVDDDDEF